MNNKFNCDELPSPEMNVDPELITQDSIVYLHSQLRKAGLSDLVTVDFNLIRPGLVEISQFWSEVERNKGHGTRALSLIVDCLDQMGCDAQLVPHFLLYDVESDSYSEMESDRLHELNLVALSNEQLSSWYAKFGFEKTGQFACDDPYMVRAAVKLPGNKMRISP